MSKGNIKLHIESQHEGVYYNCDQCNYTAKQKNQLSNMWNPIMDNCDQCSSYKAMKKWYLKLHERKDKLKMHIESKHDGVFYNCDQCGYKAIRKS